MRNDEWQIRICKKNDGVSMMNGKLEQKEKYKIDDKIYKIS